MGDWRICCSGSENICLSCCNTACWQAYRDQMVCWSRSLFSVLSCLGLWRRLHWSFQRVEIAASMILVSFVRKWVPFGILYVCIQSLASNPENAATHPISDWTEHGGIRLSKNIFILVRNAVSNVW